MYVYLLCVLLSFGLFCIWEECINIDIFFFISIGVLKSMYNARQVPSS